MSSTPAIEPAPRGLALSTRLAVWIAVTFGIVLAAAAALFESVLWRSLEHEDDEFLELEVRALADVVRDSADLQTELAEEIERHSGSGKHLEIHLRAWEPAGGVRAETGGMSAKLPPGLFPDPGPSGATLSSTDGVPFRVHVGEATRNGRRFVIQAAVTETGDLMLVRTVRARAAGTLAMVFVPAVLAGWWLARRGLRPVELIAAAAGRIGTSNLHERIPGGDFPPEIAGLASSFNGLLDRLQRSFEQVSLFSANIAHELRTPINNLRTGVEVALSRARSTGEYREALESSLEEADRLKRLVERLLFLARAEAKQAVLEPEEVGLREELERMAEYYAPQARDGGILLRVECPAGLAIRADRTLLQSAVSNLVENALRHTPRGGTVSLRASASAPGVELRIADTGEGIPADHLARVSTRFYRPDPSRDGRRGGTGLGLAIVRAIAGLHGGSMTILSEAGRGTEVVLAFPDRSGIAG